MPASTSRLLAADLNALYRKPTKRDAFLVTMSRSFPGPLICHVDALRDTIFVAGPAPQTGDTTTGTIDSTRVRSPRPALVAPLMWRCSSSRRAPMTNGGAAEASLLIQRARFRLGGPLHRNLPAYRPRGDVP